MGFLNNTVVTVDAVLTKKGRELLAKGQNQFNITKFALADDDVDYRLWDVTHPNGSDFYGAVIENMPLTEAFVDEHNLELERTKESFSFGHKLLDTFILSLK